MHSKLQLLKFPKKYMYIYIYLCELCYLWLNGEEWDQQTKNFIDINLPNGCFVGHKRIHFVHSFGRISAPLQPVQTDCE